MMTAECDEESGIFFGASFAEEESQLWKVYNCKGGYRRLGYSPLSLVFLVQQSV